MTESLAFKSEVSSYELSLNNCITVGMFLKKGVIAKALQHLVKWKQLETLCKSVYHPAYKPTKVSESFKTNLLSLVNIAVSFTAFFSFLLWKKLTHQIHKGVMFCSLSFQTHPPHRHLHAYDVCDVLFFFWGGGVCIKMRQRNKTLTPPPPIVDCVPQRVTI